MIFLVAYGGGHVAMLAPIADALTKAGRPFIFLALTTARDFLDRLDIPSIGFRDLPGSGDNDVQNWGRILAADLPSGGSVALEETVAYLGLNFRDLVQAVGEAEAWLRYRNSGRQAFLPVRTLESTLSLLDPNLVIATNSPRAEQAAIIAAGRLGIPSICAVDLFATQEVQWIGQSGYADRVCVLNESVRDFLIANGRLSDEVIVTGNPAFDRLTAPEIQAQGYHMRRNRCWDDCLITLLWASQVEPEQHPFNNRKGDPTLPRRVESELRDFVAAHPEYRLVVRYHPSEHVEFVCGDRIEFSPIHEPISVLLHAVDVVVVTASTVGLEASIAGKPVISVDMSIFTPDTLYSKMGVSLGVTTIPQLHDALIRLAPQKCEGVNQAFRSSGITATQRVLSVIDSLL